jgi:hypothetical protein
MTKSFPFEIDENTNPEKLLVQVCFHFSILIEYQLNDLQANVREFVQAMSNAIQEMDNLVVVEGKSAQSLFESLFNQGKSDDESTKQVSEEASKINTRANKRANEIFSEALNKLHPGKTPIATFNSDPNEVKEIQESKEEEKPGTEANDKIWSEIAKKFESFCRMEERLRPQVYTMIQSLNFEDIQTQRIEHALNAQKRLNEGMMKFITKGLHNCTINEIKEFADELIAKTQASYTMMDERKVFEEVFIKPIVKKNPSTNE